MSEQEEAIIFVDDKTYKERLHTCHQCPSFSQLGVCKNCGCVMVVKAKLKMSSCPENKWE
jgi:membrane protease subunit (stomatin/prohibitin family)